MRYHIQSGIGSPPLGLKLFRLLKLLTLLLLLIFVLLVFGCRLFVSEQRPKVCFKIIDKKQYLLNCILKIINKFETRFETETLQAVNWHHVRFLQVFVFFFLFRFSTWHKHNQKNYNLSVYCLISTYKYIFTNIYIYTSFNYTVINKQISTLHIHMLHSKPDRAFNVWVVSVCKGRVKRAKYNTNM